MDYKCVQPDSLQVKEGRQLFDKSFCTGRDYFQYKVDNVYVCTCRTPPRGATASHYRSLSRHNHRRVCSSPVLFALFSSFFSRRLLSFFLSLFLLLRTSVIYNQTSTLRCYVTISTIEFSIMKRIWDH